MRPQRKSHWCGVASIANALEVLGIRRTQREIAKLCHVTAMDGTNETEMKRALLANGVHVDEVSSADMPDKVWAFSWLRRHILSHGPVILCVDNDEHWVTAVGYCADRYIIFDPSRNMGIEVHDSESLALRWVNADGIYYGIGVSF